MKPDETPISRAEFRSVADRVELTELLSRYHQTIDRNDFDALDRVFARDARCAYLGLELWGVEDVHLEGRERIIEWLRAGLGQFEDTNPKHFFANHVFEIDGDVAHTRSYMHGLTPHIGGVYEIEHHRTEEGWRIADLHLLHFSSKGKPNQGKSSDPSHRARVKKPSNHTGQ
ncbi:MAG: nuclear transport factor 2 family protein [Myxococcota bacterium]|jgi:hypothetical protein